MSKLFYPIGFGLAAILGAAYGYGIGISVRAQADSTNKITISDYPPANPAAYMNTAMQWNAPKNIISDWFNGSLPAAGGRAHIVVKSFDCGKDYAPNDKVPNPESYCRVNLDFEND